MHLVEAWVSIVEPKYRIIRCVTRNCYHLTENKSIIEDTIVLRAVDEIATQYINAIRRTITWTWCSITIPLDEAMILKAFGCE